MQSVIRHFMTGIWMFVLLGLFASCSRDAENADVPSAGEVTLSIGFRLSTRASDDDPKYEEGDTYENYIDIPRGNYRLYFFDAENKFIARFEPSGFIVREESNYTQYSVLGKAPEGLEKYSDFKLVVLANWPEYRDAEMEANVTTIADICNAEWAQFRCLTDFNLNPDAGRLIPFYGVHEYKGIVFKAEDTTLLKESVTLLRAMAKVEVILEIDDMEFADDLSFSSLKINRYNAKGYCAPADVFHQDDYDHNGDYDKDYVHTLHLVDGKNDEDKKTLDFLCVNRWSENNKMYEKWIAYVPEYKNIDAGNGYSSIQAKFNIQLDDDAPHTIYFAEYAGRSSGYSHGDRLNIERNNIYRFHVKCTSYYFNLKLHVSDWEGLYENNFEYGKGQFTTPTAPWEDEINNEVEF